MPLRMSMVWATDGSSTLIGWNRRSRAASFSRCLRYSSSVVAPIVCSSPRASMGLRLDDALGESLDDGGLADAGLADQDGVVLGAAGENLHHPLDLALTPDDRVELLLPCELGEVATELVEDQRAGGSRFARAAACGGSLL